MTKIAQLSGSTMTVLILIWLSCFANGTRAGHCCEEVELGQAAELVDVDAVVVEVEAEPDPRRLLPSMIFIFPLPNSRSTSSVSE
jgi:hypothetical protein